MLNNLINLPPHFDKLIYIAIALTVYLVIRNGLKSRSYRAAAQSWVSTSGTVLVSKVEVFRSRRSSSVSLVFEYEYKVNGQVYKNNIVRAGDHLITVRFFVTSESMHRLTEKYPVGAKVTVYYNPANPGESALER
jgi:hypothetical protein